MSLGALITTGQIQSHVTLQVMPNLSCRQVYGAIILPTTLCTSGAGGKSTCGGDSGGPLVYTDGGQRMLVSAYLRLSEPSSMFRTIPILSEAMLLHRITAQRYTCKKCL